MFRSNKKPFSIFDNIGFPPKKLYNIDHSKNRCIKDLNRAGKLRRCGVNTYTKYLLRRCSNKRSHIHEFVFHPNTKAVKITILLFQNFNQNIFRTSMKKKHFTRLPNCLKFFSLFAVKRKFLLTGQFLTLFLKLIQFFFVFDSMARQRKV